MTFVRRACSAAIASACAVTGLVGCGSSAPIYPCILPPGHASALDVTAAGRVRWQAPLAAPDDWGSSPQLTPLAVGSVAVFAEDDVLYGLRLADGHRLWSRLGSQRIAGLWRWQNLVVELTQAGVTGLPTALLTGLDASTGQVRWTLPVSDGTVDAFSPTADGGLAIRTGVGLLEVVDLASGRVRWSRPGGEDGLPADTAIAVAGDALLVSVDGQLSSYDDRTGQLRWTDSLPNIQLEPGPIGLQASGGLVYATEAQSNATGQPAQVLLGISAANGRVKWRVVPRAPELLDAYAPGLMSVASGSIDIWQDAFNPATGRVRWQVASDYHAVATPAGVVIGPDTVTDPDNGGSETFGRITLHDTLTGRTRWTVGEPPGDSPTLLAFPAGPLLIMPVDAQGTAELAAFRMSDGHLTWQITTPGPVQAPLSAVPGGTLVYAATVTLPC
jgi:outer membrane protein assembly factor BamB